MTHQLYVHAIDSPLTDHRYVLGRFRSYWFNHNDKVSRLKEEVKKAFRIPAKDQRYHGLTSMENNGRMLRFHGDRILQDCDDDCLHTVLVNLRNEGIITHANIIAVVRIPTPSGRQKSQRKKSAGGPVDESVWEELRRDALKSKQRYGTGSAKESSSSSVSTFLHRSPTDRDTSEKRRRRSTRVTRWQIRNKGGNDSDDSDVEVLRDVDTVQERINAGRDDAIVVGDEEDSSEGGEEDEEEQPPQKRTRRANGESETEPQARRRDGEGIGEEEQDPEREAANEDSDEEEEEADEAEEARADNGGDEGGNAALNAEAGGAEEAAATEGEDVQPAPGEDVLAPAPQGPPAPSELRRWLRGLHADGRHANAFDAYAAAFEREFRSLEDLALAADNAPEGLEGVLRACGVRTLGDKARLRWAISGLPRPVRPAGVDGAA